MNEQYGSRAERRAREGRRAPKRSPKIAAAVVAALAVTGVGAFALTRGSSDDKADAGGGQKACAASQIAIAADPLLTPTLTKALAGYQGGKDAQGCARTYTVTSVAGTDMVKQMKDGSPRAQIWISENPQWFTEASRATGTTIKPGPAIASTPVVISAPDAQLAQLGTPVSSWQHVVAAKPAITVDDASNDRASALAITQAGAALGTGQQARAALGSLAAHARAGIPTDAPHVTTEAALTQWNTAKQGRLAETALQGGSPLVTVSAAPLVSGDAQTDAALAEVTTRLTSGDGRKALAAAGYRGADGRTPPSGAPEGSSALTIGQAPKDENVAKTLALWAEATKPLRMTAVFDVSGSMNESVNGLSRAKAVSQTALVALSSFPSSTSVAFWEFSTHRDGRNDYKILVPMGRVSDAQQMKKLRAAASDLPNQLGGDTGLYDTIWAAYQSAQKDYVPGSISSVTVLTDGRNDDPSGGLSLDELKKKLDGVKDAKRPVRVTTIAIGPDVDVQALQQVADLTHGRVYPAKSPQEIPSVLSQSMFDRLG